MLGAPAIMLGAPSITLNILSSVSTSRPSSFFTWALLSMFAIIGWRVSTDCLVLLLVIGPYIWAVLGFSSSQVEVFISLLKTTEYKFNSVSQNFICWCQQKKLSLVNFSCFLKRNVIISMIDILTKQNVTADKTTKKVEFFPQTIRK